MLFHFEYNLLLFERKILKLFEEIEKIGDPNLNRISIHFKHAGQKSKEDYDYVKALELAINYQSKLRSIEFQKENNNK